MREFAARLHALANSLEETPDEDFPPVEEDVAA